jgi:cytochrome c oxidase subunit 2
MFMKNSYFLFPVLVVLCQSGCGEDPNAPMEPVDLEVAAQTWNTPDNRWGEVELFRLVEGERLYRKRCAGCHLSTGEGQLTLGAPALRNSAVAKGPVEGLITTVLFGRGTMPAFRKSLQDADLALILSYVRNAWGNQQGNLITMAEVAAVRAAGK